MLHVAMAEVLADTGNAELIALLVTAVTPTLASFIKKNEASAKPHRRKGVAVALASIALSYLYAVQTGEAELPGVAIGSVGAFLASSGIYKFILKEFIDPNKKVEERRARKAGTVDAVTAMQSERTPTTGNLAVVPEATSIAPSSTFRDKIVDGPEDAIQWAEDAGVAETVKTRQPVQNEWGPPESSFHDFDVPEDSSGGDIDEDDFFDAVVATSDEVRS